MVTNGYPPGSKFHVSTATDRSEHQVGLSGASASLLYAWSPTELAPVLLSADASGNLNVTSAGGGGGGAVTQSGVWTVGISPGQTIDVTNTGTFAVQAAQAGTWNVTTVGAVTSITNPVAVTGSFYQATQPVSIASMPSTPVTGTFWQATQPVSGTFWQDTQPVSAASLPLPSNASQETGGNLEALVAQLAELIIAQGTSGTGVSGPMAQAYVADTANSYLDGEIRPLSINPEGRLRVTTVPAEVYLDFFGGNFNLTSAPDPTSGLCQIIMGTN